MQIVARGLHYGSIGLRHYGAGACRRVAAPLWSRRVEEARLSRHMLSTNIFV
ncbi:hypothetical protein L6249_00880 [Candidatus Parcubacteria bacterium]|nr:hypothetical protein [Candidatus Parcubacteria bacterium]